MATVLKFWALLDGKKTLIGTVLLFIGAFITEMLIGNWQLSIASLPKIASTFNWFGMAMGGIGMAHKFDKANNQSTDKPV